MPSSFNLAASVKVNTGDRDTLPADWEGVRVDLWKFTAGAVKVVE
ncbi:hypothetical protein [Streptomyces sp. NRRL B-1347]|nr:hypothetical protein [Streptomyces sp. NRRL B-1347]